MFVFSYFYVFVYISCESTGKVLRLHCSRGRLASGYYDQAKRADRLTTGERYTRHIVHNSSYKERRDSMSSPKVCPVLKNRITVDHRGCEVLFYLSDYHDQSARGNFSTAREQAEKLCDRQPIC